MHGIASRVRHFLFEEKSLPHGATAWIKLDSVDTLPDGLLRKSGKST
jgi:hypothetical protein